MLKNESFGRITFMEFGKEARQVIEEERIILLNILLSEIKGIRIEL